MEELEKIEVPANLTWGDITGDGNAMNPSDYYITGTQTVATAPLQQGDNLTYDGSVTSASAAGLEGFGNAMAPAGTPPSQLSTSYADYGSIKLQNGYAGTVTLAPWTDEDTGAQVDQVSVMTLTVQSGTIAQQAVVVGGSSGTSQAARAQATGQAPSISSTDLTVYGTLTWTGGTIGNAAPGSTTAANLWLEGGGSIAPAGAGTVSLGDTLQVDAQYGATTLTQNPGTIQLVNANAEGVDILPNATLNATTYTQGDVVGITSHQAGATNITISPNAVLGVIGPGAYTNDLHISNAGTFNIYGSSNGSAIVSLSGGVNGGNDYDQAAGSDLRIENGSAFTAKTGIGIAGGTVYLYMNANLPANQQTATVNVGNGGFNMSNGIILFGIPIWIGATNPVLTYGSFTVNGSVNWTGGTYCPSVDYTTAGLANVWIVNGTLTSAATCVVQPNPQRGTVPPNSASWAILRTSMGAGALPQVAAGSPLVLGAFPVAGNIVWQLTPPPPKP